MDDINLGDRVKVLYREHSIPCIDSATVIGFEGNRTVVEVDNNVFESGDSVISVQNDDVVRI